MPNLAPAAMRRLMKELKQLQTSPPEGIRIVTDEENMLDLTGIIAGPEGTPYEGGYFRIKFSFTEEFPAAPPKCWFITKIFHPNVSRQGEICVNTLKKDWKREYGIAHILVTIKCLLIYPNPESALDEAAGKLLLEKYDDYCKHARMFTSVHATPKIRPPEFDMPEPVSAPTAKPIPDTATSTEPTPKGPTTPTPASTPKATIPSTTILQPPAAPKSIPSQIPKLTLPSTPTPSSSRPTTITITGKHHLPGKSAGPPLSMGPLQPSSSNTNVPMPPSLVTPSTKLASGMGGTGGVKRPAVTSAGEKRKKGLKRL